MAEYLFGKRDSRRHQEGRPIDRVETNHVLADQMDRRRPKFAPQLGVVGIAEAGDVVGQRIEPHVHHVPGVRAVAARHRNAPVEAGARDAEVLEAALDEAEDFIAAAVGLDELGVCGIMVEQPLLVVRQSEKPAGFLGPFDRSAVRRQFFAPLPVDQLRFLVKGFVANRIKAGVAVEVEVPLLRHCGPDRLAGAIMIVLRRPDKTIIGYIKSVAHIFEQ